MLLPSLLFERTRQLGGRVCFGGVEGGPLRFQPCWAVVSFHQKKGPFQIQVIKANRAYRHVGSIPSPPIG